MWARADQLAAEASAAARVRALSTHPDVVALRVERVRSQVDRLAWSGIVLGLAFTMTNVQSLAAVGVPAWSLSWWAAWLLDPMVSLVLVAVLRAEQILARWQVQTGPWVRAARWTTLAATYAMNTWSAWAALDSRLILLHSVPPLVVFVAAEAVTDLRERLTDAVVAAAAASAAAAGESSVDARLSDPPTGAVGEPCVELSAASAAPRLAQPLVAEQPVGEVAGPAAVAASATGPGRDEPASRIEAGGDRATALAPASGPSGVGDGRVGELADLLVAGVAVTGEQAGVIFGVSDRTGRRLLDRAKRSVDRHETGSDEAAAAPTDEEPIGCEEVSAPLGPVSPAPGSSSGPGRAERSERLERLGVSA